MRKYLRFFAFCMAIFLCIFMRSLAETSQPTIPPELCISYVYGIYDESLVIVKEEMQKLGYFPEKTTLTGRYNDSMREAVTLFQKNNDLELTGNIDAKFLNVLFSGYAIRADIQSVPIHIVTIAPVSQYDSEIIKNNIEVTTEIPATAAPISTSRQNVYQPRTIDEWTQKSLKDIKNELIIIVIICIVSIMLFYLALRHLHKVKVETVRVVSPKYNELCRINTEYYFNPVEPMHSYNKRFDRKLAYDQADPEKFFSSIVYEDQAYYSNILNMVKENRTLYDLYRTEVNNIEETSDEVIAESKVSKRFFLKTENKLIEEAFLRPQCTVVFCIIFQYRSPHGQNHYRKEYDLSFETLDKVMGDIQERKEYEASKKYQRALMTPALRYDIMKRDHFRCCICGATQAEGAKLHVDHILPVAKGGKTVPENLRTLCDTCNLGKSDKYDPYGIN